MTFVWRIASQLNGSCLTAAPDSLATLAGRLSFSTTGPGGETYRAL